MNGIKVHITSREFRFAHRCMVAARKKIEPKTLCFYNVWAMATGFTVDGTFVGKTFVLQRFCSTLQVPPGKKKNLVAKNLVAKTFVFKRFLAPVSWLCQEKKLQKTFVFKRFLEYRQHLPRKKWHLRKNLCV